MSYPRWRYHKNLPQGKIFYNADEEFSAGEGWVDHPLLINITPKIVESKSKKEKPIKE